ncbi:arabinosyltransferase domain-containing protein [Williamsia sp. CHRR-6]|uniref:arabinosyltransferase domain-containing protein n=1 Tax=Williamsia sp. CHRR-6 TaxID=2835871 RepID=UPI001BDAD984|nr:arabinosyltransferase domain-containing protein [Williamsia sp. CHRR-6]MBT0567558.1 arabinosyltransferase domain-containing protein [Williamsia sp. CHRR-6]
MPARLTSASTARLVAAAAGLLGVLACILTPLLPVHQQTATLTWPQGQTLSADTPSVVAPLTAQTPQSLEATIPCSLFASVRPGGGVLLATMPAGADRAASKSLVISATAAGGAVVSFRNTVAATATREQLRSPRCRGLTVFSRADGPGAQFVGVGPRTVLSADNRPQVSGLYSTLSTARVLSEARNGLRVEVAIDNRYDSRPTALKLIVMIVGLIAVVVSLIALARLDWVGGYHRRIGVRSWRRILAARPADVAVTAILGIWLFLGAGTPDDGYILTMGRAAQDSGYLANYYRFFNAPEAPFDWYYSALGHWSQVSTAGLWMHLPALAAGLLSWFVLSRVLLPRLGAAVRGNPWAVWAGAAVFLAFWLPFDSGLRSEPIIATGALLTWWGVEQAVATRRLLPVALALICAGLTLALAPHGLIAVAIVIVGARPLLRVALVRRGVDGSLSVLAPLVAAAVLTLVVVFRDQSLSTVYDAVRLRYVVGPTIPWNQEYLRYYFISVTTEDGALTRRVPVLLLIAGVFVTLAVMLRRKRIRGVDPGPTWRLVGAVLLTLLLLVFTPSKWTIQFGIFAGLGAAVGAVATVAVVQSAARSSRNLAVFVSGLMFALAAAMAGQNAWPWAYDFGISWFDRAPVLAGRQVSTMFLILAVLAGAVAVYLHLRQDFSANRGLVHADNARRDRRRLVVASSPIALIAALLVLSEVAVFAKAAVVRDDRYTVFSGNIGALGGDTCALADKVLVEPDPNVGTLLPADGASASTALAGTGSVGFTPDGVAGDLSPDPGSARPGQMNVAGSVARPFTISGGYSTTLGGNGPRTVNGSTAALPFGLDPARTPVLGSYGYNSGQATLTTDWYRLPARSAGPLIVITAAGSIASVDEDGIGEFGQKLTVQFGRVSADGTFAPVGGPFQPIDAGPQPPNYPWRNLRIPTDLVPADAEAMRVVVADNNLNDDQWIAITPPRLAVLATLQSVVGSSTPTLIDFTVAAQFPCQQPITSRDGVTGVPRWRILPDRITAVSQSRTWQASDDGGLLGISEGTTTAVTVPTYLSKDWYRDWGSLERLTPLAAGAATAVITTGTATRWGFSHQPAIRAMGSNDE